jgi:hypothetical protein
MTTKTFYIFIDVTNTGEESIARSFRSDRAFAKAMAKGIRERGMTFEWTGKTFEAPSEKVALILDYES